MPFLSASAPSIYKRQAIKDAELQQKLTDDKLSKSGTPPTGYQFKELIGKGAYGRVYKRYASYLWPKSPLSPVIARWHLIWRDQTCSSFILSYKPHACVC